MTAAIGVLCERKRLEEKQVIQVLADAGVPAVPVPPAALPLPVVPFAPAPQVAAAFGATMPVVVDRCQDRAVASAVLPLWQGTGAVVIGAGIAATGNRLAVASALSAAGVPRPATLLVASEEAGLQALETLGYPATLLPLTVGAAPVPLLDRDAAEAVLEHRQTLGGTCEVVGLLQAGTTIGAEHALVIVVGGSAVASRHMGNETTFGPQAVALAEAAAKAIGADVAGIELVRTTAGLVVWDVQPVPDFRDTVPLGDRTAGQAIADLAAMRLIERTAIGASQPNGAHLGSTMRREVTDGVALAL